MADILITGGTIITMDPERRVIDDGAVAVEGDRIVAVGTRTEVEAQYSAARTIDAQRKVVMPGLIDAHGHAGHGLAKTLGGGYSSVWAQTTDRIYAEGTTEEFWYAEALLTSLERLKFGVTCGLTFLGGGTMVMRSDDSASGDRHCEAVESIGIREFFVVGPSNPPYPRRYTQWDGDSRSDRMVDFDEQLATAETLLKRWHGAAAGRLQAAMMLPVHNPARNPVHGRELETLQAQAKAARDLSRQHGILFSQDGHSQGTVKFAHEALDILGPDALLSHSTGLTDEEIRICADTGTVIVHNPSSAASYVARCPVPELIDAGVNVILGSDGTAPDRSYDMFRHMFQCMRHHRAHYKDAHYMPPGKVLEMVTIDSAKGLGLEKEIGSLEAGKKADIILIDMFRPHLYPTNMPVHRVVSFANGNDVDTVIVDGVVLMEGRAVRSVDEGEVLELAQREADAMLDRMGIRDLTTIPQGFWGHSRLPDLEA